METKLKLIRVLDDHREGVHLREISRILKTGLPNVVRYAKILQKERVIRYKKDANLVKLLLKDSPRTIAYLKQVHTEKFLALPSKVQIAIEDFLSELETKPLITLIFGSYAKGNYTEDSDIDIFLIFQKVKDTKSIENSAHKISMSTNTNIQPVYLDYHLFKTNFLDKKHFFSGEIRQEVILLSGVEIYYNLLWGFLG